MNASVAPVIAKVMVALAGGKAARCVDPQTGEPFRIRRNSYYEGQLEDRLWRPFAGGQVRAARRRAAVMLRTARKVELRTLRHRRAVRKGLRTGAIGRVGLEVLEILLMKFLDYRTGCLEPAVATIADELGRAYSSVHRALKRLREAGWLYWMRRCRPTGNGEGPQIEQITNAYVIDVPPGLRGAVDRMLEPPPVPDDFAAWQVQRRADYEAMIAGLSCEELLAVEGPTDSHLAETLAGLARSIDQRANPPAREKPGESLY